jgi:hypothetical protein
MTAKQNTWKQSARNTDQDRIPLIQNGSAINIERTSWLSSMKKTQQSKKIGYGSEAQGYEVDGEVRGCS